MNTLKKMFLIFGIGFAYCSVIYITFYAVARVYSTNDPILAKKVVILAFFVNIIIFIGSWYLFYKLKILKEKK